MMNRGDCAHVDIVIMDGREVTIGYRRPKKEVLASLYRCLVGLRRDPKMRKALDAAKEKRIMSRSEPIKLAVGEDVW